MAVHAILTHGPDVDMAQIAAVAGVSKPVLYRYFTDKAQLWVAVGERLAQTVSDAVTPAIGQVREERHEVARRYEQDPEFRQRVAQHHRDSDGTYWSWAQIWLNPAYRSWSMVDR